LNAGAFFIEEDIPNLSYFASSTFLEVCSARNLSENDNRRLGPQLCSFLCFKLVSHSISFEQALKGAARDGGWILIEDISLSTEATLDVDDNVSINVFLVASVGVIDSFWDEPLHNETMEGIVPESAAKLSKIYSGNGGTKNLNGEGVINCEDIDSWFDIDDVNGNGGTWKQGEFEWDSIEKEEEEEEEEEEEFDRWILEFPLLLGLLNGICLLASFDELFKQLIDEIRFW